MNIDDILEKINNGEALDAEESKFFIKTYGDMVGKGKQPKTSLFEDVGSLETAMNKAMEEARKSPEFVDRLKERLINNRSSRFVSQYGPILKAIVGGGDIAISAKQINSANRASRSLVRPSIPLPSGIDPAIGNAIRGAEQGTLNAVTAGNAARRDIFDQYNQDLAQATTASTGQAATRGALGQVAATRRTRGTAGLVPLQNQVRQQELSRLDNLLALRQNAVSQQDYLNQRRSGLVNDQYNLDAQAAGQLGATGRLNLRNSIGHIANILPQVAGRVGGFSNPYLPAKQPNVASGNYSPDLNDYETMLNNNITGYLRSQQSPSFNNIDPYNPRYNPNLS